MRVFINPVKEVQDAYENRDFIKGFVHASLYFEYEINQIMGNFIIDDELKQVLLESITLGQKLKGLLKLNLVNRETFKKIWSIIEMRNKLVHPSQKWDVKKKRMQDISLRFRLTSKEMDSLLHFKECYQKLMDIDVQTLERSKA